MRMRLGPLLGWGSLVLSVALVVATLYLLATLPAAVPATRRPSNAGIPFFLVALGFSAVGAFLASRRDGNRIAWMACGIGLGINVAGFGLAYPLLAWYSRSGRYPGGTVASIAGDIGWLTAVGLMLTFLLLAFPDGRLLSARWRPVAWLAGLDMGLVIIGTELSRPDVGFKSVGTVLLSVATPVFLGISLASIASLVLRYRRAGSIQRLQLKWFVAAALTVGIVIAVLSFVQGVFHVNSPLFDLVNGLAYLGLPLSIGIAVLKYRLYDIDVVINRALVYGVLAAFITIVYVAIVVGIGALIGSRGQFSLVLSILATALVAIGFQPVKVRVEAVANRLVYGYRATPYEALTQFSHRVAGAYADEEVLMRLADVLVEGTGASVASVWLEGPGEATPAATSPKTAPPLPATKADRVADVRHQGEVLGRLTVKKRPGEPMTPVEDKLLDDLAAQAGQVLRNVRLTTELQTRLSEISAQAIELRKSRQRIVAAQDAERRRLERNIHDGAQQHLVALAVKLRLTATFAKRDPARARLSIDGLRRQTRDALETLGALAAGLYPPVLRDEGIAAALSAQTALAAVPVHVADHVGRRYPEELEAAVYFCCQEAIQNAVKHAQASRINVLVDDRDGDLRFDVSDDGQGFDQSRARPGVGMQNMADRIAAAAGSLDVDSRPAGGTTVRGRVPAPVAVGS
jgi:signal transduction histidine kinase